MESVHGENEVASPAANMTAREDGEREESSRETRRSDRWARENRRSSKLSEREEREGREEGSKGGSVRSMGGVSVEGGGESVIESRGRASVA